MEITSLNDILYTSAFAYFVRMFTAENGAETANKRSKFYRAKSYPAPVVTGCQSAGMREPRNHRALLRDAWSPDQDQSAMAAATPPKIAMPPRMHSTSCWVQKLDARLRCGCSPA